MNAKEARQLAEDVTKGRLRDQYDKVKKNIEYAAAEGDTSMSCDYLMDPVVKKLQGRRIYS